ncbi:MAG: CPBP family intramembrane metalloprotease [Chitinophagaceae bacterium]|nr:CPBP family intramembrane metalloprotease [Chitinophagaceae bacterium]MCW5927649.1 CPBP family intramembrane metalloprotease [Chitinophagaceae bacterium]
MQPNITLKRAFITGTVYSILLSVVFVLFSLDKNPAGDIIIALPYFIVLYFAFFTIGKPAVADRLRHCLQADFRKIIVFPLLLLLVFYSYVAFNGENPLKGTLFLVPFLLFFPVLAFAARDANKPGLDWFDFTIFFLYFFPVTLVKVDPSGNLPFNGGGFDSVYRIAVMLSAIFAFSVVRDLRDVGAYPVFRWKFLFTVLWVWAAFYAFVFVIGYGVDFIQVRDASGWDFSKVESILRKMLSIFLHTALFEELVFRGLLQNMLYKRIRQSASWKTFWWWWMVILVLFSLLVGYAMKGNMQWFPALITIILFGVAWFLERSGKQPEGSYTALAIASIIFGLVHFHSGSIVFTGLASIGGWAYGYVYLKTKNIFYAALLHALVNSSPLIFGLELAK